MWYSRRPASAAAQLASDVGVVLWCVVWAFVGRGVHDLVASLAGPARTLAGAGAGFDATVKETSARMAEVPLVGDALRDGFTGLAGPGEDVAGAGLRAAATIERLGVVLGLAVAALPILLAAAPWAVHRVGFARRTAAVRDLARAGDVDLLALRALTRQPVLRLAAVDADPAGAWRRGDPGVVAALARLELRDVGTTALPHTGRTGGRPTGP